MVKIYCANSGQTKEFNEGAYLSDVLEAFDFEQPNPILAAKVNNVVEGLKFCIFNNLNVEFLDYGTYAGRGVYCRSLCFLLAKAARDVMPGCRLSFTRPVSKGYFCQVSKDDGTALSSSDIDLIRARMQALVHSGAAFHRHEVPLAQAVEMFRQMGYEDKVKLLSTSGRVYVTYHTLEGTPDMFYDALLPDVGYLRVWSVEAYRDGMFLRVPDRHNPSRLAPFEEQPKTFKSIQENARWNEIMGLKNVGDMNMACAAGKATSLIQVSEALQEKKIVQIAEDIADRYNNALLPVRLVLITGPSSSGKSTVCKRLGIQLMACGLHPVSFSTDDYFVDREKTPKLPDGSYDFDNFDTVDHDMLQRDLLALLEGRTVEVPKFNFVTGKREYIGKKLTITPGTVLIVEGIHALNPRLTDKVPQSSIYRIFINTITSICLDDHNCIPTSDNRLLRRIVRDYNAGAFSARATISNWPNVRGSEVKWIYPYQEMADAIFNSAYLVEFAVLRSHAERILATVPRNCPEYSEASRLMKFLQYFNYISDKEVPSTSLLRGFIGGSSL